MYIEDHMPLFQPINLEETVSVPTYMYVPPSLESHIMQKSPPVCGFDCDIEMCIPSLLT